MEILVDTAKLEDIRWACDYYPISGVTCNPTIIKNSANPADPFEHLRKIREIVGFDRTLHAQVVSPDSDEMIREAHELVNNVDRDIYIKVPVTQEGFRTITHLKREGFHVTATTVYDTMQAFYALAAGADYIAIYVNRMDTFAEKAENLYMALQNKIEQENLPTRIMASGFHSAGQLKAAFRCGVETATVTPDILKASFNNQNVINHVASFKKAWESMYGERATLLNAKR